MDDSKKNFNFKRHQWSLIKSAGVLPPKRRSGAGPDGLSILRSDSPTVSVRAEVGPMRRLGRSWELVVARTRDADDWKFESTPTSRKVSGTERRQETFRGSLKKAREWLVSDIVTTAAGTRSKAVHFPIEIMTRRSTTEGVPISVDAHGRRNSGLHCPFQDKICAYLSRIEIARKYRESKESRHIGFPLKGTKVICGKQVLGDSGRLKMLEKIEGVERKYAKKQELATRVMEEVAASQKEGERRLAEKKTVAKGQRNRASPSKFLVAMEERKKERISLRNAVQERKKLAKEEKNRELRLRESERISAETLAAREWQKVAKEKKRLEKERAEAAAMRKGKLREAAALARDHYRRSVLWRTWKAWRMATAQSLDRVLWAEGHRERALKAKAFAGWMKESRDAMAAREKRADRFHRAHLGKSILRDWRRAVVERRQDHQVAVDWYEFKLVERHFRTWWSFTLEERIKCVAFEEMAESCYERKLKAKYMRILRNYPNLKKLDVAMEKRKFSWRRIIQQILPDYQPSPSEVFD